MFAAHCGLERPENGTSSGGSQSVREQSKEGGASKQEQCERISELMSGWPRSNISVFG